MYALSEEHREIRRVVREIAEAKIAPFAAAVDEEGRYPHEAHDALLASDLHALHVPESYGGAGADALAMVKFPPRAGQRVLTLPGRGPA